MKSLIDGGFGANNPSYCAYDHFFKRETSQNPHRRLAWDSLNFVNLGTGTSLKPKSKRVRVRQKILPKSFMQMLETMGTIRTLATDAEEAAAQMRLLASCHSSVPLRYERFSATTGVHEIKLDKYNKLNDIREKTIPYIDEIRQVGTAFDLCAQELARDYLARRNANAT